MRIPLYYRVLTFSVHELPHSDWDAVAKIEFVTTSGAYYTILGKHLQCIFRRMNIPSSSPHEIVKRER